MARARNIKPGFFKNEDLAECSVWARLLFPGLWMLADREGRIEDRPKRIKGEIFPFDAVEVDPLLTELEHWGFICRYVADGKRCIQINNFNVHQSPHGTERDSDLPDKSGVYTVNERAKNGCITGKTKQINTFDTTKTVNPPLSNGAITVNPPLDNALNPDSPNPDSLNPELIPIDASHLTPDDPSGTSLAPPVDSPKFPEIPKPEPPKTGLPDCPHRLLLDRWAKHLPQLIQPRSWEGTRAKTMRQRWQQAAKPSPYSPKGYATESEGLAWWDSFFEYIATGTSLATGFESNGRVWKPDLEWVCNAANFQKIIDGKYEK